MVSSPPDAAWVVAEDGESATAYPVAVGLPVRVGTTALDPRDDATVDVTWYDIDGRELDGPVTIHGVVAA